MTKALCRGLIVLLLWTPMAQAEMIGTDRAVVHDFVSRTDVARELQSFGLDPATARDRVAAMTDAEARALAGTLDTLPAGGQNFAGVIVVGILVFAVIWWFMYSKDRRTAP